MSATVSSLHVPTLSTEASSDSSNDSVGVVPVTYSTAGQAPPHTSLTSNTFAVHQVSSAAVPSLLYSSLLSTDTPFNIDDGQSADAGILTDSLNPLVMDDFVEVSSSAADSPSFSSSSQSLSLPDVISQSSTQQSSNIGNNQVNGESSGQTVEQGGLESVEERCVREESLVEDFLPRDQHLPLLTSSPLTPDLTDLENGVLLSMDEERKIKEKKILQSGKGKFIVSCLA